METIKNFVRNAQKIIIPLICVAVVVGLMWEAIAVIGSIVAIIIATVISARILYVMYDGYTAKPNN